MTTWIGQLGAMIPTLCATTLPVATEDRYLTGGGEGTVARRRAMMVTAYGGGARDWSFDTDIHEMHEAASLASLARAQRLRRQGAYRFVPCNAPFLNMLTPQASEEFDGWTGERSLDGMTVARETLGLSTHEDGTVYPAESVLLGDEPFTSPVAPLVGGFTDARFSAFLSRVGLVGLSVTLEAVDSSLSVVDTYRPAAASPSSMTRVDWLWEDIDPATAGLRMTLTAASAGAIRVAWPAITLGTGSYRHALGQCADSVVLTPPAHSPYQQTPGYAYAGTGYSARELNV